MRLKLLLCAASLVAPLVVARHAASEERKFSVMLAFSPKAFVGTNGLPGLPPDGLFNVETINKDYFDKLDPDIDSFAEYWEEISYGDVTITGRAFGWVTLPWAFEPNAPNAPARPSPANFIDLARDNTTLCTPPSPHIEHDPPIPFAYGAGEQFCDCMAVGGSDTSLTVDKCGALIIIDLVGDSGDSPPLRGFGMPDFDAVGVNVWTPGERFVDIDADSRWDGIDERNDMMCHTPNGCPGQLCSESDSPCSTSADCPPGETCDSDPPGSGPRGCNTPGCGDLAMPGIDWDRDRDYVNPSGNDPNTSSGCTIPADANGNCTNASCVPTNCFPDRGDTLLPCCVPPQTPSDNNCSNGVPGLECGDAIFCCEFDDADGDNEVDVPEPFEDYMIRWNPFGTEASSVWVPVDDAYVRNNYPGDVEALVRRTGNGYYDPPDLFFDVGSTKMMQDAGNNRFAWRTPKPGARYTSGPPNFEDAWFDSFWLNRFGSVAPAWPGGSGASPPFNSPSMRPFDPEEPVPPVARDASGRRWFEPNRGGWNGLGLGTTEDPERAFDVADIDESILPEEINAPNGPPIYYDGWVEHDDLASSKYHSEGDKRLGEITSPSTDVVTVPGSEDGAGGEAGYTAIFGVDLGKNNPLGGADNANPDNFCVAAGPGAVNIHGQKGFDAGDLCIVEWLTWRTDGTSPTIATRWENDNGPYHPFAGPSTPLAGGPVGFRDYNLDGMIDQGEVRPELSENYSVDSDPLTNPNLGTFTNYPFNRQRLVEDVVEALDASVDWNDFAVGNQVSGIVLVPPDAYSDPNRFPFNARYYPIHTEENSSVLFHDLVICQNCRDFPSAVVYAAHEYGHTWEGWPDLYDYDRLDEDSAADDENCPIGLWDIMADGGLVHPNPVFKEASGWIQPIDLETILEPGVEKTITLEASEFERESSYYFLKNVDRPRERFYFWSVGSGFDEVYPGKGMLIMHTFDATASGAELALQQRTSPFNFSIVQADGLGDLEACSSDGNTGDAGDLWPGSANARKFNRDTVPSANWTEFGFWSGLNISNIETSGNGTVKLTMTWVPTTRPVARVTVTPAPTGSPATTTGPDPFVVTFDARESVSFDKPGDELALNVVWYFGDGQISTRLSITETVEHSYVQGTYRPTATFEDTAGRQESWRGPIIEVVAYRPPTAVFSVNPSNGVPVQTEFEFNGTASTSSDGQIARFDWDFGDGEVEEDGDAIVTHTYDRAGPSSGYEVRLTVTDSRGTQAIATKSIVVLAPPDDCEGFGDWDGDCLVTLADYSILALCLPLSGPSIEPPFSECVTTFDSDEDGDIDLSDVAIFQLMFGGDN